MLLGTEFIVGFSLGFATCWTVGCMFAVYMLLFSRSRDALEKKTEEKTETYEVPEQIMPMPPLPKPKNRTMWDVPERSPRESK